MHSTSSISSEDPLEFVASVSFTTHITIPGDPDATVHTMSSAQVGDDLFSLATSTASTVIPECLSTRCNTPASALQVSLGFGGALSTPCGEDRLYPISGRSEKDAVLRGCIAANAKVLLLTLTGFEADDIVDLLFVKEKWFPVEVLIHALCLVNRLSFRFPHWYSPHTEPGSASASANDSPVRNGSPTGMRATSISFLHLCSSTSSDASHFESIDDTGSDPLSELTGCSLARARSASSNSLGDVFNRYNTRRRFVALLLLSGKFHGDVVYKTSSLTHALDKFRDEQRAQFAWEVANPAPSSSKLKPFRLPPRLVPARLGQCEKQLFQELGCTLLVRREEFEFCEALVLRGIE